MKLTLVYIANPSKKEAKRISRYLLKKRLIGCANIFPIESLYWWEGKIAEEKEWVLLVKTVEKNYEKIQRSVEKIHPYSIPCVIKIPARANQKYANWLEHELKN